MNIRAKVFGCWALGIPAFTAIILFILFDGLNINDQYVRPITLLLSSFALWFIDGGLEVLRDGFKNKSQRKNTLMWIEVKYWALVLGILGCVCLGLLMDKR